MEKGEKLGKKLKYTRNLRTAELKNKQTNMRNANWLASLID